MNPPPPTRREVVTETLHGVTISDPYRWLEDGDDPQVQQWVTDQNRYTREALDARPDRDAWHERLVALMGLPVVLSAVVRGTRVFTYERSAGADQYVLGLRSLDDFDAPPRRVVRPGASGRPTPRWRSTGSSRRPTDRWWRSG